MNDAEIIELYFARSEDAIRESEKKYAGYCRSISYGIVGSHEDAEECVNDTLLRAWNSIPPNRPACLPAQALPLPDIPPLRPPAYKAAA